MSWDGQRKLFLDYQSAASALVSDHYSSLSADVEKTKIRSIAQEISANFSKHHKRGQFIHSASFSVPTIKEVAKELGINKGDFCRYNSALVKDLEKRAIFQPEVNYDLSPIVVRYHGCSEEKLYLNCSEAVQHTALQKAGYDRGNIQNAKRQLKNNDTAAEKWISWTIQKTREKLEIRLPRISEAITEIQKRGFHFNLELINSILIRSGYKG